MGALKLRRLLGPAVCQRLVALPEEDKSVATLRMRPSSQLVSYSKLQCPEWSLLVRHRIKVKTKCHQQQERNSRCPNERRIDRDNEQHQSPQNRVSG